MYYLRKLQKTRICPANMSYEKTAKLFNSGKAMYVVSGDWFRGEISSNINYGIAKMPIINETRKRAIPFLTVEGYYMARYCKDQKAAFEVMKFFTSGPMSRYMATMGKQSPANKRAYRYKDVRNDPINRIIRSAAAVSIPMPNNPEMALFWGPATAALNAILKGANIESSMNKAQSVLLKAIKKMHKKK